MGAIITEGVLFVALVATGGALLFWLVITFTPAGIRLRQVQNRIRFTHTVDRSRTTRTDLCRFRADSATHARTPPQPGAWNLAD